MSRMVARWLPPFVYTRSGLVVLDAVDDVGDLVEPDGAPLPVATISPLDASASISWPLAWML